MLRFFYRDLTGDSFLAHDTPESVIDERIRETISMEPEDPNTAVDLREVKSKESKMKFNVFWDEAQKFINEDLEVAVDDRCHGEVTHLAKAISVRDLREQVSRHCPSGTPISSEKWLWLYSFGPRQKMLVCQYITQDDSTYDSWCKSEFQKTHKDEHYAAALF